TDQTLGREVTAQSLWSQRRFTEVIVFFLTGMRFSSHRHGMRTKPWQGCGLWAKTCHRNPTVLRSILFHKLHRLPVANEHFDDHPNDIVIQVHAYKQRIAIYEAVWVARVLPLFLPSRPHRASRMSKNPCNGIVNKWGKSLRYRKLLRIWPLAIRNDCFRKIRRWQS
ncbi:hypothetical protein LCGC14_2976670, partial [marine sediment metagenome]